MRAFAIVGNCIFPFVLAALGFAPNHASVAGEVDSRYALIVKHTSPVNLSDEVRFRSSGPLLAALFGPGAMSDLSPLCRRITGPIQTSRHVRKVPTTEVAGFTLQTTRYSITSLAKGEYGPDRLRLTVALTPMGTCYSTRQNDHC